VQAAAGEEPTEPLVTTVEPTPEAGEEALPQEPAAGDEPQVPQGEDPGSVEEHQGDPEPADEDHGCRTGGRRGRRIRVLIDMLVGRIEHFAEGCGSRIAGFGRKAGTGRT
jgi:hypothetical protein